MKTNTLYLLGGAAIIAFIVIKKKQASAAAQVAATAAPGVTAKPEIVPSPTTTAGYLGRW